MEKHFLCSVFSRQKLDIINDQHIHLHIKIGKALYVSVLDGIHKLVYKFFRRNIQHKFILGTVLISLPIAWIKWVLPKPTPPYTIRGLKDVMPGLVATA